MSSFKYSLSCLRSCRIAPSHLTRFSSRIASTTPSAKTDISSAAHSEGGPRKGSTSANLQSQATRERNAEDADAIVGNKLNAAPESITSEDASFAQSREARATGIAHPAGGIAQAAQQQAAANEGATSSSSENRAENLSTNGNVDASTQSQLDKEQNYKDAAREISAKMEVDPKSISKEEADMLHSREHRAFGRTERGGLAAQAQSMTSKNEQ